LLTRAITGLFLFVGDDAADERRMRVVKNGHQLRQLFLSPQSHLFATTN